MVIVKVMRRLINTIIILKFIIGTFAACAEVSNSKCSIFAEGTPTGVEFSVFRKKFDDAEIVRIYGVLIDEKAQISKEFSVDLGKKEQIKKISNLICSRQIKSVIEMSTEDFKVDGGSIIHIELIKNGVCDYRFDILGCEYIVLKSRLFIVKDFSSELTTLIKAWSAKTSF